MNEYLTVEQVAAALQVSPKTVRNLIARGRFPGAAKIDPLLSHSTWRIPRRDLVAYTEAAHSRQPNEAA